MPDQASEREVVKEALCNYYWEKIFEKYSKECDLIRDNKIKRHVLTDLPLKSGYAVSINNLINELAETKADAWLDKIRSDKVQNTTCLNGC